MAALDGLRVIELARVSPVAYCTRLLADMGAEVIKVEEPRHYGRGVAPGTRRAATLDERMADSLNRNKRSVELDLKSPEGLDTFLALAERASVVVEGYRPGVVARLGCDYEAVSRVNPAIVYCSLSGYGQSGPYRDYAGHDANYLSFGGALDLMGTEEQATFPLNLVADLGGGAMHALAGILIALYSREKTGKGQYVDVSYTDATFSLLSASLVMREHFRSGVRPRRGDGLFGGRFPYYRVYATRDEASISLGCSEPWLWERFCEVVERPDLIEAGPQVEDIAGSPTAIQVRAGEELDVMFRTRGRDDWFELLAKGGVPAGKVLSLEETLHDPQLLFREMVVKLGTTEDGRDALQPGMPIKLSKEPGEIRDLAPEIGADNEAIDCEVGSRENRRRK